MAIQVEEDPVPFLPYLWGDWDLSQLYGGLAELFRPPAANLAWLQSSQAMGLWAWDFLPSPAFVTGYLLNSFAQLANVRIPAFEYCDEA